MAVAGAVVSLLRGKQFYYDETPVPPAAKTFIPNGPSRTAANGDAGAPVAGAPVAGAADSSRQRASG
jgi:hypothetical protein